MNSKNSSVDKNFSENSSPNFNDMITGADHLMNRIFFYIVAIRSLSLADAQYCTFNTDCQSGNYCWNRQCTTNFGSNFPGASGLLGSGYSNNQYNGNNYGSLYPTGYGGAGYGYNNYGYGYSFGRRMVGDRCTVSSDCQTNLCWQGACIQSGGGNALVTGYGLEGTECINDLQCIYGTCVNRVCRSSINPTSTYGLLGGGGGLTTGGSLPDGYQCSSNTQCVSGICFYGYCGSNRYGSLINPYGYTTNWNYQYPNNNCGYTYSCTPSQSARLVIGSNVDGGSLRRSGSVCATDAECYSGTCFSGICSNDSPVPGKVGTSGQCTVDARCYSSLCNNGQCT